MPTKTNPILLTIFIIMVTSQTQSMEEGYLRYVKDGCFLRNEALSCIKFKALKLAKKTLFENPNYNETFKANHMISFVPLDVYSIAHTEVNVTLPVSEPRGLFSEWTELTKYALKLIKDFFKTKGLRVNLPDGARAIEEEQEEGRGRRKKLAVIVPLLTLLAALKTKFLLIPVLLAILMIKKLLLLAALLIPSLLHTLKVCKVHHPGHAFFGAPEVADVSTGYANSYALSSGTGYSKDWASNRAYAMPKPRPNPMFVTAPGGASA